MATDNKHCIPGRFWTTIPARERSEGELEALHELAELVEAEAAATEEEVNEILREWLSA